MDDIKYNSLYPSIPNEIYHRIIKHIEDLEKQHNIHIIYAVENGSRLSGLWHEESDFDIRFVFSYNRKILNTVNGRKMLDKRDTFEGASEDKLLDWQGWCIDKTIEGLKSSNPSIIEWINSDIIYKTDKEFVSICKTLLSKMHNINSLYYHYFNMAKQNWNMFIKDKKEILYKKYLYVMRPILMIIYIQSFEYKINKETNPIINDYYELLNTVLKFNNIDTNLDKSRILNIDMRLELELVAGLKKTNKGYEGPPLINLNNWIQNFFDTENEKQNNKNTSQTDYIVMQSLQTYREKVINELKKINAIGNKSGTINRADYLSLFGQYTMYMWLIQHPKKCSGDAPQNINNLLKEITIDTELSEWIHHITMTKTERSEKTAVDLALIRGNATYIFLENLKKCMEDINSIWKQINMINNTGLEHEYGFSYLDNHEITDLMVMINNYSKELVSGKKIPRDDLIEHCFRNYLSQIWLILSDQNARNIPKDIFSEKENKDIIPSKILELFRYISAELRPVYIVKVEPRFHEIIQKDLIETEEYVSKMTAMYLRKKELDKQVMYKGSFQLVDPDEFLMFLEKYI